MRKAVLGAMGALCGVVLSGCGPEDLVEENADTRLAKAQQALTPPQIPDLCTRFPTFCNGGGPTLGEPVLGRGWNAVSDRDLPSLLSCLETFTKANGGLNAPRVSSSVQFVSDVADIKEVMRFDARVNGGLPGGAVPVSGSLYGEASRTVTAKQSTINLVVHTRVEFAPGRITSTPRLTTAALQRFDGSGPAAFRAMCGDRYAEQVAMGAEYMAVFKISSSNTTVQSEIKAQLLASLGSAPTTGQAVRAVATATNGNVNAGINSNGSLSTTVNNTRVNIEISMLQNGGPLAENPTSMQQIINRFTSFPSSLTSESELAPMTVTLKPWNQTANFGTRAQFALGDSSTALSRVLGPAYAAYFDAYNELSFAVDNANSGMFFPFDVNAASRLMNDVAIKLLDIEDAINACGASGCTEATTRRLLGGGWETIRSELPIRKQLYVVTGTQFLNAATNANVLSVGAPDGWTTSPGGCKIDEDENNPTYRNFVRIWSASGVGGSNCRFKLFQNGRLAAPWQIEDVNAALSQSEIVRMPTSDNLLMDLKQLSLPWSVPVSYVRSVTLAGPQGDPAASPWRAAIRRR